MLPRTHVYFMLSIAIALLAAELVSRERPGEAGGPALDRGPADVDRLLPHEGAGAGEPAARRVGRQGVRARLGALHVPLPVRELRGHLQQGVPGQGQARRARRRRRHLARRPLARPARRRGRHRPLAPEPRVLAPARRTAHLRHRGGQEHLLAIPQPVRFAFCITLLLIAPHWAHAYSYSVP